MAYPAIRRRRDNVLQRLFQRPGVAVAGRDGTLVQSGATGATALHPTSGAVVSAGGLISHNLPINGVGVLPMSFAQGARTNLWVDPAVTLTGSSSSLTGLARTITEDSSSGNHFIQSASSISLTDGVTYRLRAIVSRKPGSLVGRHASIRVLRLSNQAGVVVNLDTGAASNYSLGTGVGSGAASTALGSGRFLVEVNVSCPAWGGLASSLLGVNESGSVVDVFFVGDGVSGVVYEAVTLEAATFSGLGLAEGATRAADNILWTPPSALSTTSGEVVAVAAPYLWSAGAGVDNPTVANMRWAYTSGFSIYKLSFSGSGYDAYQHTDAGGSQGNSLASLADTNGVIRQQSMRWSSDLRLYRGSTLANTDSAGISAPWNSITSVVVGSAGASQHAHGFVGLIYVPNGLTDAERTALARLTAGSITYVG